MVVIDIAVGGRLVSKALSAATSWNFHFSSNFSYWIIVNKLVLTENKQKGK